MMKRNMLVMAVLCILISFCTGCNRIISEDLSQAVNVTDYVDSLDCVVKYDLCIFPSNVDEEAIKEYYFKKESSLMDDTVVIYVKCKYGSEAYEAEVDRISRINYGIFDADDSFMRDDISYAGEIRYTESDFNYPAYVTVWLKGTCCSYALIDKDNQEVVYVYLQYATKTDAKFDKDYYPQTTIDEPSIGNLIGYLP